jgi:2-dehydro-3-deoxyphosphogluconate aldolase/(4S)-4-hydroxy-2-oxoglutarate aldolase
MNRQTIVETMQARRVSAILRTSDAEVAARSMEAAVAGGFRLVEFTLTTPSALELIGTFSKRDDLLVGAGTVLTTAEAEAAVKAGARFLVSPIVDPEVIRAAASMDVVSIPGASTATEIVTAHRAGADIVKIFPAPADLPAFVTQIRGPLPGIKLFPTAGVTPDNFLAVLRAGAFGVGFVASLFEPSDMAAKAYDRIRERAASIHRALSDFKAVP